MDHYFFTTHDRTSQQPTFFNITDYEIQTIARSLDPRSVRSGSDWLTKCPAHDNRNGQNLSLGTKEGKFVVHCFAGCRGKDVMDALKHRGLIPSSKNTYRQDTPPPPPLLSKSDTTTKDKENTKKAQKIWSETVDAKGTLVETYFKFRGLTVTPPDTIRFHPALEYWDVGRDGKPILIGKFPAMVAKVQTWPSDELQAVHRTYLQPDGNGKADVSSPKKILGPAKGGAVQFNGDSLDAVATGEGNETCLSYYQENHSLSVWAALSSSNMKNIIVPPYSVTKDFIILSDNDSGGIKAAEYLATRLTYDNRVVRITAPVKEKSDFNDILKQEKFI